MFPNSKLKTDHPHERRRERVKSSDNKEQVNHLECELIRNNFEVKEMIINVGIYVEDAGGDGDRFRCIQSAYMWCPGYLG